MLFLGFKLIRQQRKGCEQLTLHFQYKKYHNLVVISTQWNPWYWRYPWPQNKLVFDNDVGQTPRTHTYGWMKQKIKVQPSHFPSSPHTIKHSPYKKESHLYEAWVQALFLEDISYWHWLDLIENNDALFIGLIPSWSLTKHISRNSDAGCTKAIPVGTAANYVVIRWISS